MKKLSKLMALLLSLLMIVSLFAACGDDKKGEEGETTTAVTLKGEDLLLGKWDAKYELDEIALVIVFDFIKGGTVELSMPKENYDNMVKQSMDSYSDEDIADLGFATREEAEAAFKEYYSYEELVSAFETRGEWELDGDTLTIKLSDETMVIDTKLSEGVDSFKYADDDGAMTFTKNYKAVSANSNNSNKEETKEEAKPTGEALLIGKWEVSTVSSEGVTFITECTFAKDGAVEITYSEESYNNTIQQMVDIMESQNTKEQLAEIGITNTEEYFKASFPYESLAASMESVGTWALDGDTLTLTWDNDDVETFETKLSNGKTSFSVDSDGITVTFTKVS